MCSVQCAVCTVQCVWASMAIDYVDYSEGELGEGWLDVSSDYDSIAASQETEDGGETEDVKTEIEN